MIISAERECVCFSEWQSGVHRAPNHPWSGPLQVRAPVVSLRPKTHACVTPWCSVVAQQQQVNRALSALGGFSSSDCTVLPGYHLLPTRLPAKIVFIGQIKIFRRNCSLQYIWSVFLKPDYCLAQFAPLFTKLTHRVSVTSMNSHVFLLKGQFDCFCCSPVLLICIFCGQVKKKNNTHLLLTFICLFCPLSLAAHKK